MLPNVATILFDDLKEMIKKKQQENKSKLQGKIQKISQTANQGL